MNSQNMSQFPLLKPISLSVLEEIEYSDIILEAHAKIEGIPHDIVLVDDLIMVYCDKAKDSLPLGYARLDSSLKFQRIFSTKSFSERELKGFKLLNDFNESITFLIEFANITTLWILHLSKVINESGFHSFYKPIRVLGKGSSATVYEIARLDDGKRFAAKVFSKEGIKNNRNKMSCFMNQLEIMRSIEHSNLLKLEGVFESEHSFYVIMEILGGGNLFEYLVKKSALSCDDIKILMRSILKGLGQLQASGIIHRDIKLQNLMLKDRQTLQPVIVDFGLAVQEDDQDYVYYQCGTPGYISPEVLTAKRGEKISSKSDIFSAGVLLHVLLSGKYLFEGKSPKEIFDNNRQMNFDLTKPQYQKYDKELMELMKGMLQKNPQNRLSARQCLRHASLSQQQVSNSGQKFQLSPVTSAAEYHF